MIQCNWKSKNKNKNQLIEKARLPKCIIGDRRYHRHDQHGIGLAIIASNLNIVGLLLKVGRKEAEGWCWVVAYGGVGGGATVGVLVASRG